MIFHSYVKLPEGMGKKHLSLMAYLATSALTEGNLFAAAARS